MEDRGLKLVYAVVQRDGGRTHWIRIGSGWTNRDGSVSLRLDAVPVGGALEVRDAVPAREGGPAAHGSTKGETR